MLRRRHRWPPAALNNGHRRRDQSREVGDVRRHDQRVVGLGEIGERGDVLLGHLEVHRLQPAGRVDRLGDLPDRLRVGFGDREHRRCAWPCALLISACFSPSDLAIAASRAPFARLICSCCLPSDVAITARFSRSAVICACIACRISFGGVRSLIS